MKKILLMAGLLLNVISAGAQSAENKLSAKIPDEYGKEVALNQLGYTRIVFKDGTKKKNCIIREIKPSWVIYIKDRVLHDAEIDKIKCIELENGYKSIFFDKDNKPMLKANN